MISYNEENYSQFYKVLDSMLHDEIKWKDYKVQGLNGFINLNLRLILEQTQSDNNAYDLQQRLFTLSSKINQKFTIPSANNLAFKVMGIAQGIFSAAEDKIDYTTLVPSEIRQKIYANLIATAADYKAVRLVSKTELEIAEQTKIMWINKEKVSLKASGCKTAREAIDYIQKNQNLCSANLRGFNDFSDDDLKELQNCTWIQHLFLYSYNITNEGLKFLKIMQLKSVDFQSCTQLTDEGFEYLKEIPLESVNFNFCDRLTDNALEFLKEMPLKNVYFKGCHQLTDKALEHLQGMPLQSVNFGNCNLLTDNGFKFLQHMQLQSIKFKACTRLTDKSIEYLKGMPLHSINFHNCHLLTDQAFEYVKGMPLENVDFSKCAKLTNQAVKCLKGMPLQKAKFSECCRLD